MIEFNKEYTYSEFCKELGWVQYQGGSRRKMQMKVLKESFKYYNPLNKKGKPKRTFIFTSQIKDIEFPKNGGAREGSGRNKELENEFDIIMLYLILHENSYKFLLKEQSSIYIRTNQLRRYFGIYDNLYIKKDKLDNIDNKKYYEVCDMVRNRVSTIIKNKSEKREWLSVKKGLVVRSIVDGELVYSSADELMNLYNALETEYIKENMYDNVVEVVKDEKWADMNKFILNKLKEYNELFDFKEIIKCTRIEWNDDIYKNENLDYITDDACEQAVQTVNKHVTESIYKSCLKKSENKKEQIDIDDIIDEAFGIQKEKSDIEKYVDVILKCVSLKDCYVKSLINTETK